MEFARQARLRFRELANEIPCLLPELASIVASYYISELLLNKLFHRGANESQEQCFKELSASDDPLILEYMELLRDKLERCLESDFMNATMIQSSAYDNLPCHRLACYYPFGVARCTCGYPVIPKDSRSGPTCRSDCS